MAAQRLTDRVERLNASPDYLIHIVDPSDTSQNAAGSSYKMKIGQLLPGGGTIRISNTPISNSADTNKNILDSYDVPANTLSNDGDVLEIECNFVRGDAANPAFTAFVDTPNFTTGINVGGNIRMGFILRIVRISATTYTRYAYFIGQVGGVTQSSLTTHNIVCDFTSTFRIDFAIQNAGALSGSGIDFSRITLIKKLANANIEGAIKHYYSVVSQQAADTKTSGTLLEDQIYTITTYVPGDDFSNVAQVISGTINTTGCVFKATGDTPTNYSNGSTLDSTGAPFVHSENSDIGSATYSADSDAFGPFYKLTIAAAFGNGKKVLCFINDGSTLQNVKPQIIYIDTDTIRFHTADMASVPSTVDGYFNYASIHLIILP